MKYGFELYYDGSFLTEDEAIYDSEDEARAAAYDEIDSRVQTWKEDGAWNDDDSEDRFSFIITTGYLSYYGDFEVTLSDGTIRYLWLEGTQDEIVQAVFDTFEDEGATICHLSTGETFSCDEDIY